MSGMKQPSVGRQETRVEGAETICMVAIARDECSFLDEWIAYHRVLGIDHFFIYDDDPITSLKQFLEPHGQSINVIDWYKRGTRDSLIDRRCAAYRDALTRVQASFDWVIFSNIDEFLVLPCTESLPQFLKRFDRFSQVSFNRYLFGHNGCVDDPPDLVTNVLTRRMAKPSKTVRSIVRPNAVTEIRNASVCELASGHLHVDANGNPFTSELYPGKTDDAHVNHYLCRSYLRWMQRPERGSVGDSLRERAPYKAWQYTSEGCLREFVRTVTAKYNELEDASLKSFKGSINSYLAGLEVGRTSVVLRKHRASRIRPNSLSRNPASFVVYTAISAGYDDLSKPLSGGAEWVAFMEDPVQCDGWSIRPMKRHSSDPNRNSKIHKVLAHTYFPSHEFSLWVDGSVRINVPPEVLLDLYMKDFDIVVHVHPDRNCVFTEAAVCKRKRLDDPGVIDAQMDRYRREAYPMNAGLHENMVILRRHNHRVQAFNELWWDEIQRGSRRDQLSSTYVARRIGLRVGYFPGSLRGDRDDYSGLFTLVPHLKPRKRSEVVCR